MKYIRKFEGVGDKYAEKKFFIKDPGKQFDFDYEMYIKNMKPVAYVKSRGIVIKDVAIFKNPKSLNMFESGVRAIGTSDGDLFVAQGDYHFYHQNMGAALKFGRVSQIYKMQDKLVFLYRDEISNSFHIGEVTSQFNKNKKDREITESILRAVKRKNPKYDFYNSYGIFSGSKPISLVEPKPKNIFGKLKDLIKTNEEYKSNWKNDMHYTEYGSNWKIGDIIVAIQTKYATDGHWLHEDYRYEIVEFAHVNTTVKVKEIGKPYDIGETQEDRRNRIYTGSPGLILNTYFFKDNFITLEDWELKNTTDKYNL